MAKTRPGADRITKLDLQRDVMQHTTTMAQHEKYCETCLRADKQPYLRCKGWWEAARLAHRAKRKLKVWQLPETGDTIRLFTMDDQ